jgi:hypothetical protein
MMGNTPENTAFYDEHLLGRFDEEPGKPHRSSVIPETARNTLTYNIPLTFDTPRGSVRMNRN